MVSRIFPLPEREYPEILGELAVAVQFNVVPVTEEESRMFVVCPEQMDGVEEFILSLIHI